MKLRNKVAIVTGGARGIGLAIAKRYVAEGANVTIADIDRPAGAAAAGALGEAKCRYIAADVGNARDADNVVAETCRGRPRHFGQQRRDRSRGDFLDLAEADFDRVLRVNPRAPFSPARGAADGGGGQAGKPPGAIINMSSVKPWSRSPTRCPIACRRGRWRSSPK
jgi:NAD(P)-dependent dehydrogenase (short-subunit alcohol dehydrogenase family)